MARKLLMDQLRQLYSSSTHGSATEGAVLQSMQWLRTKRRLKWRPDKISVNLAVEVVVAELTSIALTGKRGSKSPKQNVEFRVLGRLGQRDDVLTEVAQVRQQLLARALGCSVAEVLAIAIALDNGSKPSALAGKGSGAPATDWEVVKHMFRLWLCGNTIDEIAAAVCVRTEATVVTQLRKLITYLKDVAGEAHAAAMILLGIMLWLLRNLLTKHNLPSSAGHITAKWTLMAIAAVSLTADC